MGLFDKIGKKNSCSICDEPVGLLDQKLADGFLCKNCKKKLSPYFDVSKQNTVQQIKMQIEERETVNSTLLSIITPNKIYGDFGVIFIDEEHKLFAALPDTSEGLFKSAKAVTSINEVMDKNPDVISFSLIKDVDLDLKVTSSEEKQTVDGKQESYNPKHYTYMCDFTMRILVNHPYVQHVYVPLSNGTVQIYTEEPRKTSGLGEKLASWLLDLPGLDVQKVSAMNNNDSLTKFIFGNANGLPDYSYGFKVSTRNKNDILKYLYYIAMAGEIKNALSQE